MQVDWKQVRLVALFGGLGGLLYWIYSEAVDVPLGLGLLGSPLASFALGVGAGVLGVYLVAKTDMSAALHSLVFAMACGFSWRPVLEGTGALVEMRVAQAQERAIGDASDEAVRSSSSLRDPAGTPADSVEAMDDAVSSAVRALRREPRRTSVSEERSARLDDVVANIHAAPGLDARKKIEGLREIGSAATMAGDPYLAFRAMEAIADLTSDRDTPQATREEAARAVEAIGGRARLHRAPALEVNSDVIGEAIRTGRAIPR